MASPVYHRKPKYEDPSMDGKAIQPIPQDKPTQDVKQLNNQTVKIKHNAYDPFTKLRSKSKRNPASPK